MSNVANPRSAGRNWTATIKLVKEVQGHECYLCGQIDRPEVDHVVSWNSGQHNEYDLSNLGVLCRPHNRTKGAGRLPAHIERAVRAQIAANWDRAGINPDLVTLKGGKVLHRGEVIRDYR